MELTCGNCQGRFIAAVPGSIVACPHCGVHLQTPAAESAPAPLPIQTLPPAASIPEPSSPPVVLDRPVWLSEPTPVSLPSTAESVATAPDISATIVEPPADTNEPAFAAVQIDAPPPAFSPDHDLTVVMAPSETPTVAAMTEASPQPADSSDVLVTAPPTEPVSSSVPGMSWVTGGSESTAGDAPSALVPETSPSVSVELPTAAEESQTIPAAQSQESNAVVERESAVPNTGGLTTPADEHFPFGGHTTTVAPSAAIREPFETSGTRPRSAGVSRFTFMMTLSYAGLVTLLAAYLLFLMWRGHALESLPDLAPLATGTVRIPAPRANMAPGHTLALGESRVYGYVKVTPLRVTRGPLSFESHGPVGLDNPRPSGPVLKLWLRFENISPTDDVVPLDRQLVFFRRQDKRLLSRYMTFNFLCSQDKKKDATPPLVYMFDHSSNSSLELKGQNLEHNLAPGRAIEAYIPTTEEGWNDITGALVWRVHFRKGHNSKTRAGITTLIEVVFDNSAIVAESPGQG
ncbi:MAG: hypothetical protein HZA46_13990 [Planctomycetales bacterium]|nr:hypothetical protein [Planctomycetales bacterium]